MKIKFRLIEATAPSGEIRAFDLARISSSLHEASVRLGRSQASATGPGRSRRSTEELSEVRAVGLRPGSTVLEFVTGPPDMLPLEIEEMVGHEREMTRVLVGLAEDHRPGGLPGEVADSIGDLAQVLRVAAAEVELTVGDSAPLRFRADDVHRETWVRPRRSVAEDMVTLSGVLEKIDIYSHDLRIRDDVGNTLSLVEVARDVEAASLIGQKVSATGHSVRSRDGNLLGVQDPVVAPFASTIPIGHVDQGTLRDSLADLHGPDPDGGVALSDEEFARFMEAMGR